MHRNRIIIFLWIVLIGLCAGCDSGPSIKPIGQGAVILAFGDSLTYGTGAPRDAAYPQVLSNLLSRRVINAGIPGEISDSGRKRLSRELDKHKPTLLILCHGGNDFLRRLDLEETRKNLKAMVEMARVRGIDVVLVGVPKLGWGLNVPSFYRNIAEEYDIPYQDNILVDLLRDNSMKSDTIHPNATGYRLLAEAIHGLIDKAQ